MCVLGQRQLAIIGTGDVCSNLVLEFYGLEIENVLLFIIRKYNNINHCIYLSESYFLKYGTYIPVFCLWEGVGIHWLFTPYVQVLYNFLHEHNLNTYRCYILDLGKYLLKSLPFLYKGYLYNLYNKITPRFSISIKLFCHLKEKEIAQCTAGRSYQGLDAVLLQM